MPLPRSRAAHWSLRIVAVAGLLLGITIAARKFGETPEQEELRRYVELTVPAYLEQIADVRARFERLDAAPAPAEARAALAGEITPRLIALKKRAQSVAAHSPSVARANERFIAAVDAWIEAARAGVRAIDDPAASPEESHRKVSAARAAADEAVRAWMTELRAACATAGFEVTL